QLSLEANKIVIAAMTGFQKYQFNHEELVKFVSNSLESNNKILFLQKSLTGSLEAVKQPTKSKVSMVTSLRKFRTIFDTKRIIIPAEEKMLFTRPYLNVEETALHRALMNQLRQAVYSNNYHSTSYTSTNEIQETIKHFLRSCCEYFNFKTSLDFRLSIVKFIQKALIKSNLKFKFEDLYLLKLIKHIELNPSKVYSKLPIYRRNKILVDILLNQILYSEFNFDFLLDIFKEYFDNFDINTSIVKINDEAKDDSIDRNVLIKALLQSDKQKFTREELIHMINKLDKLQTPAANVASPTVAPAANVASPTVEPLVDLPVQPNPIPKLPVPWPSTLPTEELVMPKPFGKPLGPPPTPKKKTSKK